jgi:hypothetical protein
VGLFSASGVGRASASGRGVVERRVVVPRGVSQVDVDLLPAGLAILLLLLLQDGL